MYHNQEKQEIEEKLKTNENGLTEQEAEIRLKINGANEIPKAKEETILKIFIEQFISPIVGILLIAGAFSIYTKSYADAIFILAVITINAVIGTYQEWSSKKSAEKLQEMIKIKAKVIREGNQKEIEAKNIVIGDIVLLESGDKVPADLKIIEEQNLKIDESILTGESIPKEKEYKKEEKNIPIQDRKSIAYAGSITVTGRGKGIVIAVGQDTEFGKIAKTVITSEETKTPLVIKMEKFIKQISIGFIILAVMLSILLISKGMTISEIFETVVALTVSAIPEGLTIAMTIVLSISSSKMAEKNVIVKKLNAVEAIGSCTVIATDKTGTLTVNEQTAKKIVLKNGKNAYIKGAGYNDLGEIIFDENETQETIKTIEKIIKLGVINNEATLKLENNKWIHHGDAIDTAFLALGLKLGTQKEEKEIINMIPYESSQKYSAVFYKENQNYKCTIKGATEKVLEFCPNEDKKSIINQNEELSKQGFRVIAIADGNIKQSQNKFSEKDISNLEFLGLVAFVDPIRPDAKEAVETCKKAGIKTVMITGDHPLTAKAIAERIGIEEVHSRVSPMEKLEIVESLKLKGEFVAVTGDGVNDSPALKAANIGVAMGSGTDIAKETGNMIIADDNFSSIVKGIEEGRKAYNNIRKVIYLLLSTGFSEIILFVLSIICGLPIPLVAIQLLWLNLISNGIQGDALAFENAREDVMKNAPLGRNEKIFNKLLINEILISSLVMGIIEFIFYVYLLKIKNLDITLIRTYLLTLMVFMENIHIFNCRSETLSITKISGQDNRFLIISIIVTSLIQLMIVTQANLAEFFGLTTISIEQAGSLILFTVPVILIMEAFKNGTKKNRPQMCSEQKRTDTK